ncbi:uncharacterized protein JN550_006187 [Neoarthrinium moseri]|uniref:uncharacterized protein n=1 Tax=Neoarthrinium moseri TaxID=1658444 RepID=UPI001FDC5288|nr:uncharacterized protein JN550_006187 [Neoarthrinium moseri]KAI1868612.1 hypothetical protein JN550_006187 [Neoarthrinium moseri]
MEELPIEHELGHDSSLTESISSVSTPDTDIKDPYLVFHHGQELNGHSKAVLGDPHPVGTCFSDNHEIHVPPSGTRRLWDEIHHTAQWGAIPDSTGMARLTLSDEDREVRNYFVHEAEQLGCRVDIDQMGNIFAVLPGENNNVPPIGIGSHLDTQPAGGRYDGILGVLSALEVLKSIKSSGIRTYAPIAAIDWTNEEGARFAPGCNGSAVWAGHTPLHAAYALRDTNPSASCTLRQELERIGYLGAVPASCEANKLSAHFELHIEQRRILQDTGKKIGVVTNIQGIRWYRVCINGRRAHAGGAPMHQRADAVVAAAKVILFLDARARVVEAVATVGVVELERPSSNTVPGKVIFTIDLRHPSEAVLDDFEARLRSCTDGLTKENVGIGVEISKTWHSPAVKMDDEAMACTKRAAEKVVGVENSVEMISLAGHDSALTATKVPTSMVFVPSKDGISHAPEEFTSEEDCGNGLRVILEAVLGYDSIIKQRYTSQ